MAGKCKRCGACAECGATPAVPQIIYVYPYQPRPVTYQQYPTYWQGGMSAGSATAGTTYTINPNTGSANG